MPYQSISVAEDDGFPITAEGVPLTLSQINKLASIYDAVKEQGTADNPMAVAWTQWKQIYKKEGDKWVKRSLMNVTNVTNNDKKTKEQRCINAELRVINKDGKRKITGYAAVFNSFSENLGGFVERIMPGAFKDAIDRSDVRALFNHNPDYVLGRSTSGTLKLTEDDTGLYMEIDPPDTQFARDLMVSIERGDISQQSFGFTIDKESWEGLNQRDTDPIRNLENIGQLFDVSPVTYPAYPDTTVALRSMDEAKQAKEIEIPEKDEIDFDVLKSDFYSLINGKSISDERRAKYIKLLDEHKPSESLKDEQIVKEQKEQKRQKPKKTKTMTWEEIIKRIP